MAIMRVIKIWLVRVRSCQTINYDQCPTHSKLCPLVSVVTWRECGDDKYFILHDKIIFLAVL